MALWLASLGKASKGVQDCTGHCCAHRGSVRKPKFCHRITYDVSYDSHSGRRNVAYAGNIAYMHEYKASVRRAQHHVEVRMPAGLFSASI